MKYITLVVLALAAPALAQHATGTTKVNDPDHINRLNSIVGSRWVAGFNEFFSDMTFDQARMLLGTALSHIDEHMEKVRNESVYGAIAVPTEFDSREQWPNLIHPIRNQMQCGSCWAFSASEVLSDRVSIASRRPTPVLSAEDMVSCDRGDNGCDGGQLDKAWEYLESTGIVTDSCFPYSAGNGNVPRCVSRCFDSESFVRTKAASIFAIKGVLNMQKEIATNGPIQVAFMVYKSFMSYRSGIYSKHTLEFTPEGGHAVKIVGYGTEDGVDYWTIANSWGTTWGERGFFRIKRGNNECGIEKMGPPFAGLPAVRDDKLLVV